MAFLVDRFGNNIVDRFGQRVVDRFGSVATFSFPAGYIKTTAAEGGEPVNLVDAVFSVEDPADGQQADYGTATITQGSCTIETVGEYVNGVEYLVSFFDTTTQLRSVSYLCQAVV